MEQSFCKNCGKELEADSKFCPKCGTPNSIITESVEETPISEDSSFQTRKSSAGPYGSYRLEDLPEGFIIDDRYDVREKLGQGGFGAVYRAYDRKMVVDKAIKVIPDSVAADREAMNELHSEARIMVSLNNQNIVRVYDVHDTGSIKYIDMEFIDGKPLNELKLESEDKKLPEGRVKELGLQIAKGLAYAHNNQVIHKDIKPQNIMVNDAGLIKIMDFGISESVRTSMSRLAATSSSGTLVYMSPEQIRGEDVGKESDIYSFGTMVYELLSGHPPFYKGAVEYQIFNEMPKPINGVSDGMNALLKKCLEKEYSKRFESFDQIEKIFGNEGNSKLSSNDKKKEKESAIENIMKYPENKDLDKIPKAYSYNKKQIINILNMWGNKHKGIMEDIGSCCSINNILSFGQFSWHIKGKIEKRSWTNVVKGINSKGNANNHLDFINKKPLIIPELTPELIDAINSICIDCDGTGTTTCSKCDGTGYIQCSECKGVGKAREYDGRYLERTCSYCQGTGKLPCTDCNGQPEKICASCNSSGIQVLKPANQINFPIMRDESHLWDINSTMINNKFGSRILTAPNPENISICKTCKGTGVNICSQCQGTGYTQCSECKGVGKAREFDGRYLNRPCSYCRGKGYLPCISCNSASQKTCLQCGGSGVVAVYPAIKISRDLAKIQDTTMKEVDSFDNDHCILVLSFNGDPGYIAEKIPSLFSDYEGGNLLELSYSAKEKDSKLINVELSLYWYPYILCEMKNPQNNKDFVLGINSKNKSVFLLDGKYPKSDKIGFRLLELVKNPFANIPKRVRMNMLDQLK